MPIETSPKNKRQTSGASARVNLTRRTLPDSIYREIRASLMKGVFAPGDQLTLRGIAGDMGTSVMPVREAFKRLTAEGALELLPNGTIRVPALNAEKLREITEIRMVVEGLAARRAAEQIESEEITNLQDINRKMLAAIRDGDSSAESRLNEEFHFGIYRAARSEELLRIIENLWLRIGPFLAAFLVRFNASRSKTSKRGSPHHAALIKALKAADGEAAETALRRDLAQGVDFLHTLD